MKTLVDTYLFMDGERVLFKKERFLLEDGSKSFRYVCPCRVPEKYRNAERWALGKHHKPNRNGWKGCIGDVDADEWLFIPRPLPRGEVVWWAEGEKDARTLCGLGARAVSTHQGAGHSTPEQAAQLARAGVRGVWVCMDNDIPGARDAWDRYEFLQALGVKARIVMPGVGHTAADITDHFSAGLKKNDLIEPPLEWVELQANKYTRSIGVRMGYEVAE